MQIVEWTKSLFVRFDFSRAIVRLTLFKGKDLGEYTVANQV